MYKYFSAEGPVLFGPPARSLWPCQTCARQVRNPDIDGALSPEYIRVGRATYGRSRGETSFPFTGPLPIPFPAQVPLRTPVFSYPSDKTRRQRTPLYVPTDASGHHWFTFLSRGGVRPMQGRATTRESLKTPKSALNCPMTKCVFGNSALYFRPCAAAGLCACLRQAPDASPCGAPFRSK